MIVENVGKMKQVFAYAVACGKSVAKDLFRNSANTELRGTRCEAHPLQKKSSPNAGTEPLKKTDFIICSVFSLLMLLYYPLGIARAVAFKNPLKNWSSLEGFTWEVIGYFALSLIILKVDKLIDFLKKHKFAAIGTAVYICMLIIQQIFIFPSLYYLGGGITYLALVAVGFLYANEWKKLLQPLLWIFFIFSLLMNLHDFIFKNAAGLTGNWNWSSTLTLISSGSIFLLFSKKLPSFERKWGIYFSVFTFLFLIYLYFVGHFPKGTILSAFLAGCLLFWCYLDYFMSRKSRFVILAGAICITALLFTVQKDFIGKLLSGDARIYLWENGLRVIAENPLFGCEYGRYITVSADKMSPEYFLTGNAAVIHNHPHNEFLFLLSNFGIGGIIIIIFMLYTLVKSIHNFERRKSFFNGYFLFIYTVLLIHSMLDVLLLHWPNNLIFYLLVGGLVPFMQDNEENIESPKNNKYCILAVFAALLGLYLTFMNFMASMYYRHALSLGKNYPKRLEATQKSISFRPKYQTLNDAAVLSGPPKALSYFKDMAKLTGIENYAHSNLLIANFHMAEGNITEALPYYAKEYQCFPLSVRNLFFFRRALLSAGKKDEAVALEKQILEIIKVKGLQPKHINILINYQDYDLNSNRIPAKLLNYQPQNNSK